MTDLPIPSKFVDAPAPWELPNTDMWIFTVSLSGKSGQELPRGSLSSLEAAQWSRHCGPHVSRGGLSLLMLVRYNDTPVGTYDELLTIPGRFLSPDGSVNWRVTRMYVSNLDSVANGRRYWNVPKQLAKFTFTPSPSDPRATEVRVFETTSNEPTFSEKPFFAALLTPISYIPALPFNNKYFPKLIGTFPPLPASSNPEEDGRVGTVTWKTFHFLLRGSMKLVRVRGLLDGDAEGDPKRLADGVNFPDVTPYSTVIYVQKGHLTVIEPTIFSE